jgi:hypothetical protein
MSRHKNAEYYRDLQTANKSFENERNSNIWKRQYEIKITFTKKLRAD